MGTMNTSGLTTSLSFLLDEDACLSAAETAQLLGVDKITLLRMRQLEDCGGLPWVRVSPGRIGYMRRDIRAYLASRRVGALPVQGEMAVA
jgi:predicted DNA-binding transcriptional regulator YafY